MKICYLVERIGPYHAARFNRAAEGGELVVAELNSASPTYNWDTVAVDKARYQRIVIDARENGMPVKSSLELTLDRSAPDVVFINGWSDPGALSGLNWCLSRNVPHVLMSDSQKHDEPRRFWREWVKRALVAEYDSAFVGGSRHVDYLVDLGMPRDRIFAGYDVVDNAYFAEKAKEARSRRSEIRAQYKLPENYFLASARFIPKKNLFTLLRAYAEYRKRSEVRGQRLGTWDLVLLGDGPLKSDLCRLIADLELEACVQMPGFKQYDELPIYYGLANAFVHASTTEQWGLVVNEAMACGLPVLVSNRCGCVPDLVKQGINGFAFDPEDISSLADLMGRFSSGADDLMARGIASQRIISEWDLDRFSRSLWKAAEIAVHSKKQSPRLAWDRLLARGVLSLVLFRN